MSQVGINTLYYLDQLTSSPHQTRILERLVEVLPILEQRVDQDCAALLLRVAFFEQNFRLQPHMTFADLDPLQQKILQSIAETETLWRSPWEGVVQGMQAIAPVGQSSVWPLVKESLFRRAPAYSKALTYVGLPSTRQGLQAFLAITSG